MKTEKNVASPPADGVHVGAQPRVCQTTARGYNVGTSNGACKYPDAVVDEARRLRATGMTLRAVGDRLGVPFGTISDWCDGTSRLGAVRLIVRSYPPRKRPPGRRRKEAEPVGSVSTSEAKGKGRSLPPPAPRGDSC
jgi:hypothetical protein